MIDTVEMEITAPSTPERDLCAAVLERTVLDLQPPTRRREFTQARRFVMSTNATHPFSFVNLCLILDLDVESLRARLLRLAQLHAPAMCAKEPQQRRCRVCGQFAVIGFVLCRRHKVEARREAIRQFRRVG